MKTKFLLLTIAAVAIASVTFIACNESEGEITPDPTPTDNRTISGYESIYEVTYTDQSVLTLSQSKTDPNQYSAHYNGKDYPVVYLQNSGMLSMYDNDKLIFEHVLPAPNEYPGDCDKLGGRKDGESYSDCYSRNFTNFCCDFVSCAAFAIHPIPIMTAIGAACMIPGAQLDIEKLKNVDTGTVIFDRSNQN